MLFGLLLTISPALATKYGVWIDVGKICPEWLCYDAEDTSALVKKLINDGFKLALTETQELISSGSDLLKDSETGLTLDSISSSSPLYPSIERLVILSSNCIDINCKSYDHLTTLIQQRGSVS